MTSGSTPGGGAEATPRRDDVLSLPRAELLLDTDRAAAGVGMRSSGATPRQLVFRHGRHQVDLMTPAPRSAGRFLWGQVLAAGDAPCEGATVAWVARDGAVLGEAVADEFGEFRVAAPPTDDGVLRVGTPDGAFACAMPAALPGTGEGTA